MNHLKSKYGHSIREILVYKEEKEQELERLLHFQEQKEALERRLETETEELSKACQELTKVRKTWAKELEKTDCAGASGLELFKCGV